MHVVHVLPYHFGSQLDDLHNLQTHGGGERAFFQLAKAVAARVRTTAVAFGATRRTYDWDNLRVEIYPARRLLPTLNGSNTPLSAGFLRELIPASVVHVFQVHSDTSLLATLAARTLHKPVFATDYGYLGLNVSRLPLVPLLASGGLAISHFAARQYPFVRNKATIWAGVNLEDYPYVTAKERAVLCVARILPHKGINYLIDAVDAATPLTIVGRAGNAAYLEHLRALSRDKNVRFLLNASDREARLEYARAAVVVLPSVYRDMYGKIYPRTELFGLVMAEAMASGSACVATSVGALPEIVQDGVTGFIVPPNDPAALRERISHLLARPERVSEMGRQGRERVERLFTWDAVAQRCLRAYEGSLRRVAT